MSDDDIKKALLEFLQRAPLEGREAETMVLCKQWVRKQMLPPPFADAGQKVADTSGK